MKKFLLLTTLCVFSAIASPTSAFAAIPTIQQKINTCKTNSDFISNAIADRQKKINRTKYQRCLHQLLVTARISIASQYNNIINFQNNDLYSAQNAYINSPSPSTYSTLIAKTQELNFQTVFLTLPKADENKILKELAILPTEQ